MATDEKDRLDLRNEFARLMDSRLADIAMEAMPNLDYNQLATKTDVSNLGVELRGEMTELRTEMGELRADLGTEMGELRADLRTEMGELRTDLRTEMADLRGDVRSAMGDLRGDVHRAMGDNVKTIVLANLGISLAMGGFIIGLT